MGLERRCLLCEARRARPVWTEAGYRYVRCSACTVTFSDVDAETYAEAGRNVWHDAELATQTVAFYGSARQLVHERFMSRFPATGNRRLLDVGCGLGYFVKRALDAGWDAYGCDVSESWVAHARSLVGSRRIGAGALRNDTFGGGFDLITTWDVLEHVHDPVPFLETIAALLAPGGRVFIRTPNLSWVYPTYTARRRLLGSEVELGPLNHVVYYSAATLTRALRRAGLEPEHWPVLPPPQVTLGNRDGSRAVETATVTQVKNAHAAAAEVLARVSRGRAVVGSDLDVVASRSGA